MEAAKSDPAKPASEYTGTKNTHSNENITNLLKEIIKRYLVFCSTKK